jgi:diguanylate cyclase (GGDEF)-like protein/PAS domain S-box-containing protein
MAPASAEVEKNIVLIADDDPTTRMLLCEALEEDGFSVLEAKTGLEALCAFENNRPDIVLLDVMMPEMNGFEACAAIRKLQMGHHVPILMVTGSDDLASVKRAYEAGATDFISKPFNSLILSERVRYMLRASRSFLNLKRNQETLFQVQRVAKLGNWEWDVHRKIFSFSDQVALICGLNSGCAEMLWNDFLNCVHPDDRDNFRTLIESALHRGKQFALDHRIAPAGGSERIVYHAVEVEVEEDGSVGRIFGTLQDITERKMAERLELDSNHILRMIVQDEPLTEILDRIVTTLERQRPEARGCIYLVQDDRIQVAAPGRGPQGLHNAMEGLPVGPDAGCCGLSAYLGQPIVAEDITDGPFSRNYKEAVLLHNIRACVSAPILSGKGSVLGAIALHYDKPYETSDDDLKLVEKMGQLATLALEQNYLSELLTHQAQHDSLTGLLNREALNQSLKRYVNHAVRHGDKGAFFLIGLDRFKRVNDSMGHQIGDLLLTQVAERLKGCTRNSDILARTGGDEFVLVLLNIKDNREAVGATAKRILDRLSMPYRVSDHQLHVGASIGICFFPDDAASPEAVIKNADIAMYVAKNDGGNRYQRYSEQMNIAVIERLETENNLRTAIDANQFELHYQPQCNLADGKLTALEALIRWNHPELGRIPPDRFIPVAEESRLIIPIGEWVIRQACRQNAEWQRQGHPPVRVAVNVSSVQITENDFADIVQRILEETGLDPRWLEVEITESVLLRDRDVVRRNLGRLKGIGIATTIDDFGTGYSSITYLRQMPLDCLKIDRSFIRDMVGDDPAALRNQALVKAFISLAQNLNLTVVAEGVETPDQRRFLIQLGCEIGQGYLFSAPAPAEEIAPIL